MRKNTDFYLQEMTESLNQMEEFRISSRIRADRETEKLHIGILKKLDSVEHAVKEAMLGIA
jgi:hypothetical protein